MLYDLHNPTQAPRQFYDGAITQPIRLGPGETRYRVPLLDATVERLRQGDINVTTSNRQGPDLPPLVIDGMWGIGDCLHQRAPMRELMKTNSVWLTSCNWHINSDLVEQGLNLIFNGATRLRGQQLSIKREQGLFRAAAPIPPSPRRIKLWYHKDGIDKHGSIVETMFANCFIDPPTRIDFSWPIRPEWRETARAMIATWKMDGRPLLIYRPIVLRREWRSTNRNPEPAPYAELFALARKDYFVVSLAYLDTDQEWIVGPEATADLKFHRGEIPIEIIAAIVAEAQLVFCNAGFMPVLAQSVGTPAIIIYGGRESYRTTQRAGAHLAPTLGVDIDRPCDCHSERHHCDKTLTASRWVDKVTQFSEQYAAARKDETTSHPEVAAAAEFCTTGLPAATRPRPSVLIFATTYVDCPERQLLTAQWLELVDALNPDCNIMLIDSKSPINPLSGPWVERFATDPRFKFFSFGSNIGHLSRRGRDGWGRAMIKGLEFAIIDGYQYAVHIEGDSLLRVPVSQMIAPMRAAGKFVATTKVTGMTQDIPSWVETGLMAFDTDWLIRTNFMSRYDWINRSPTPTPEVVVGRLIKGSEIFLPLKAWRGDKNQITHLNVVGLDLDWITHCHQDVWCYREFLKAALATAVPRVPGSRIPEEGAEENDRQQTDNSHDKSEHHAVPERDREVTPPATPDARPHVHPAVALALTGAGAADTSALKLNLGCGTNKIVGWQNHDADVDITRPLPWPDGAAEFIFIEHCIEHVSFHEAIHFFEEAFRVLAPGGVLRVTVPSIEQIAVQSTSDYWKFASKWGGEATLHGALKAIIFAHGHQTAWTHSLMLASLLYVGFDSIGARKVGQSPHAALRGAEGHARVIGEAFNEIESMPFEATKPGGVKKKHQ